MTKKNKNIIVVIVIFVLLICLGLTIYFAGCERKTPVRYNDTRITLPSRDSRKYERKNNIPNTKDSTDLPNKKEESDITQEKTLFEESDNIASYLSGNRTNKQVMIPRGNESTKGLSSKYVVLISIETFLLGASIMYLIMNNIDKDNEIIDATIIEKKTKKDRE